MLDNISDLMSEVEKFKGTVVSSEKLINELESVTMRIEDANNRMTLLQEEYFDFEKSNKAFREEVRNECDTINHNKRILDDIVQILRIFKAVLENLKEKLAFVIAFQLLNTVLLVLILAIASQG